MDIVCRFASGEADRCASGEADLCAGEADLCAGELWSLPRAGVAGVADRWCAGEVSVL